MAKMKDFPLCCTLFHLLYPTKFCAEFLTSCCVLMEWVQCLLRTTLFIRNMGPELVFMIEGTHTIVFLSLCCVNLNFKKQYFLTLVATHFGSKPLMQLKQFWDKDIEECLFRSIKGKGIGKCLFRNWKDKDIGKGLFRNRKDKDIKKCLFRNWKDKDIEECLLRNWKDKDITKFLCRNWMDKDIKKCLFRNGKNKDSKECLFRNWKDKDTEEFYLRSWKDKNKDFLFRDWADLFQRNRTEFYRQYFVYPATAVPDRVVASKRRHVRRYASFAPQVCPPQVIPSDTWPNRLARTGFYYDETTKRICCFACQEQYPNHNSDCDRQMENIDFCDDAERRNALTGDDNDDAATSITRLRLRAAGDASTQNQRSLTLSDQGNGSSHTGPFASSGGVVSAGQTSDTAADTVIGDLFSENASNQALPSLAGRPENSAIALPTFMSSLTDRRGSYSTEWRGPSVSIMADCGLYQTSSNSAKCHSCGVTFCGLTGNSCIWLLHLTVAPHCLFLRSYRGG